jgi:tRNA (mo5U34)-methyltransferase
MSKNPKKGESEMTKESLAERVAKIKWEHTIDLGNGVITPGRESPEWQAWKCRCLPEDLKEKSVLDVGAWDGFYSFEAVNRGAKSILAIDNFQNPGVCSDAGFMLARKALGLEGVVEHKDLDVEDPHDDIGWDTPDITILFGVLYHLKNPVLALTRLFNLTQEVVCLESHIRDFKGQPVCYAYNTGESNGDPYTYWGPSPEWIERVARNVGFRVEPLDIRGDRFIARLWKP